MIKIVLMLLIILLTSTPVFSQDNNYKQRVDEIISKQILPPDIEGMHYIPYASAKSVLMAYEDLPKPTYITKNETLLSLRKDIPPRKIMTYRVYFTPIKKKTNEVETGCI
jgi:hypothetical protein